MEYLNIVSHFIITMEIFKETYIHIYTVIIVSIIHSLFNFHCLIFVIWYLSLVIIYFVTIIFLYKLLKLIAELLFICSIVIWMCIYHHNYCNIIPSGSERKRQILYAAVGHSLRSAISCQRLKEPASLQNGSASFVEPVFPSTNSCSPKGNKVRRTTMRRICDPRARHSLSP